jgi:hypothetical protein
LDLTEKKEELDVSLGTGTGFADCMSPLLCFLPFAFHHFWLRFFPLLFSFFFSSFISPCEAEALALSLFDRRSHSNRLGLSRFLFACLPSFSLLIGLFVLSFVCLSVFFFEPFSDDSRSFVSVSLSHEQSK